MEKLGDVEEIEFFFFVVESPSPRDLYWRRSEAEGVLHGMKLRGIPCDSVLAINREAFGAALTVGIAEAMKRSPTRFPILHISAHGDQHGLQLSSGELVSWADLRELLVPINRAIGGVLLVSLSCCEGHAAITMAMEESPEHPFLALTAPIGEPTWMQTAIGFAVYYHHIVSGSATKDAIEAMRIASKFDHFELITFKFAREFFAEAAAEVNLAEAHTKIEAIAQSSSTNALSTALRNEGAQK